MPRPAEKQPTAAAEAAALAAIPAPYYPTLLTHGAAGRRCRLVADLYDAIMESRGDARRAYRGVRAMPDLSAEVEVELDERDLQPVAAVA